MNASVKKKALKSLKNSIEECVMKKREVDFKIALDDAFQAFESIPVQKIHHRDLKFRSPSRWVICFLGSLRNVRNFDGITCDSTIGILIVCMTNEVVD